MSVSLSNVTLRLTIVLAVLGWSRAAAGQATVKGRLEIQDKKGPASDVHESLVWLEGAALPAAQARRADIVTTNKEFAPRIMAVPVGSTVAFPNHDPFDHNVFSTSGPKTFDLGLYGRDQTRTTTFDKPGLARIYCNVHAKMAAYILVMSSSMTTRPDRGGRFQFDGLAPGSYTLRVWHERGGESAVPLTVPLAAELVVSLDARKFAFAQHLDKTGKPYDARGRRY
jgi:plastocyanin